MDNFLYELYSGLKAELKSELLEEIQSSKPSETAPQELLTIKEVCKRFHISKTTLWRHRKQGYISPSKYVGRKPLFTQSDIEEYLKAFNDF